MLRRGLAAVKKQDPARAVRHFDAAVRLDPNNADFYNSRGLAYLALHDLERAIEDFSAAIRLKPKEATGLSQPRHGLPGQARPRPGRRRPDQGDPARSQGCEAYRNRAAAFTLKQDGKRAIADYTAAIRLDPKNAELYTLRGTAEGARSTTRRRSPTSPRRSASTRSTPMTYYARGTAYAQQHDFDRAIADFTTAVAPEPPGLVRLLRPGQPVRRQEGLRAGPGRLPAGHQRRPRRAVRVLRPGLDPGHLPQGGPARRQARRGVRPQGLRGVGEPAQRGLHGPGGRHRRDGRVRGGGEVAAEGARLARAVPEAAAGDDALAARTVQAGQACRE